MDLTKGNESRLIWLFAIPMLIGNVFQQFYMIIDSVIVGNFIGKEALAVIGAAFPVIFMLISLIIGVASGGTIIVAQYYGAKDFTSIRRAIDTLFIFLFFASIILSITGIALSGWIFGIMKLPPELLPQAKLYLSIYMVGLIFMFGFNGTMAVLRGLGDSKTPLYFLILSTVVNILLDLLFVLHFKMGIGGVALATVVSQCGAFVTSIIYLNKTHEIIRFSFRNLVFDRKIFKMSLKIGLPSGLQQTFVALGMMALMRIVNDFGTNTIAAYAAAGRIDSFASLPAMNFAIAISTFVGQNLGANKPERVRKGYHTTLAMTIGISLVVSTVVILFGGALMSLFSSDPDVISIGKHYLIIVGAFYFTFSIMFISGGVIRGAGDTLIPMFITLFSLWIIRIPLAYFLSRRMGVTGIWWSIPVAWILGAIATTIYYYTGRWKKKVIVKPVVLDPVVDV